MELKEIIIFGVIALVLIVVLLTGYVKAPPDTAFIISGIKKRILIGKAGVRIPFFERLDKLKLAVVAIDVKTTSAVPTADYINVTADANVTVKISSDKELIKIATENFLNKNTDYVATMAREILEGNMREIVGQLTLEQMVSDRKAFADKVQENSDPELRKLGLEIKSFNIQNFTDAQGLIDNLGIDNTAKIQKKAAIVKAEAEKEIEIAQSEAKKLANDARVLAETEIAQKNNELAIRQAELKKDSDIKKAQADAAYKIQEQEQRKTVEKTTADATLVQLDMDITLKERAAQIKEKELEASIKKQAEADKYAIQQKADADLYDTQKQSEANLFERQKRAEAERYEQEQQAIAKKAQAEALKFSMEQEADDPCKG
jgi:flotillin